MFHYMARHTRNDVIFFGPRCSDETGSISVLSRKINCRNFDQTQKGQNSGGKTERKTEAERERQTVSETERGTGREAERDREI